MLAEHKLKLLQDLVRSSTKEELVWINGFLAGVLMNCHDQPALASTAPATASAPVAAPVSDKPAVSKITIAYGTESGNSKKLATDLATKAKKSGINAKVVSLDQYRLNDLSKEEYFLPKLQRTPLSSDMSRWKSSLLTMGLRSGKSCLHTRHLSRIAYLLGCLTSSFMDLNCSENRITWHPSSGAVADL